jgi:hypothetical protein
MLAGPSIMHVKSEKCIQNISPKVLKEDITGCA